MFQALIIFCASYAVATLAERCVVDRNYRVSVLGMAALVWVSFLLICGRTFQPWQRLAFGCIGLLWLIKLMALGARRERYREWCAPVAELLLRFVWPGMSHKPFVDRRAATSHEVLFFTASYSTMLGGMALGVVLALISPRLSDEILGLVGLIPLFLVIHLGYAGVLAAALRAVGYPVERLFDRPECSKSLRDFWSKRWNRPFVEMNKALFFKGRLVQASPQMALFLTFVMSGLLHEFGISFPAGRGWGLPTLYFMLHGALVLFEGQPLVGFKNWPPAIRRVWVWCAVLLPLPMLFHDAFRSALIVPLYREAGSILLAYSAIEYFSWLVPIAGIAHCLPLIAGSQLPSKLEWKSDLTKLKPFNRKIMWNYGAFIFLLIIAFGCETFIFREEMVRGDPAALGLAALIFGFWLLRVMVDLFYFSHSDWPEGPEFVIGHALLNSAFVFLIVVYGSLLGWHMLWR